MAVYHELTEVEVIRFIPYDEYVATRDQFDPPPNDDSLTTFFDGQRHHFTED